MRPGGQRLESHSQIFGDRVAVNGIGKHLFELCKDPILVGYQGILQLVQSLDHAHREASCPVEPARRSELEFDGQFIKLNRAPSGIRVNRDPRWYCIRKSEIIRGVIPSTSIRTWLRRATASTTSR